MRKLIKFLNLPNDEKLLLLKAALLLVSTRLMLIIFPFNTLKRPTTVLPKTNHQVEKIIWSIDSASNHIPFCKNCLLKALVGQILLKESGLSPDLFIGVKKDSKNKLDAHAWIDIDGKTIIGKTSSGYKELIKL